MCNAERVMSRRETVGDVTDWRVPGAFQMLVPRCPACLTFYLAIGAATGVSLFDSSWARVVLIILFVASIAFLAGRRVHRRSVSVQCTRRGAASVFRFVEH
jgi:hypothetical protein